ncbi:MAG: protein kinase, partial [Gemmatimonadaceae bacterium]
MFSRLLEHLKRRIAGDGASRERLTRARWDQLQTVLTESLDRAPEERSAFLDGACAGDPLLRREAESLLQVHASPGILDRPVADVIAPLVVSRIGAEDSTDRIVSHYQVLEKLGSGGMGIVHRAHDLRLGRIVALKFLPPFLSDDERYKERFLAEAQMAAAFDHPNVCTIHEVGETEDGRLFIAMPYYDGETLKQRIAAGPLAIDEALHFGIQAAHGLSKAHERGIVHRDIKPANLMLTSDGVIKIVDFGIAKFSAVTWTHADATPGTVAYMSPEQAGGQSVDERTDIWSLGVVLYEMLAGQRPFKGAHDQVLLRAILGQEPVHLSELRPGMSHDVASAVHRALAKEPSERYDSIRSLALELERLRVGGRVRPAGASTTNGGARGEGNGPSSAARSSGALEGGQGLLPDGDRRQATIGVACVSGYADLAEHLAPDARGRLLGEIRNDAAAIAVRYGGTLNSFGDDHMVLVFGITTNHEDDCLRATRAALDLHERMRERSAGLDAHTAEAIRLHTGIDTGLVSAHSTDGEDPVYRIAGASTQAAAQLAALAATDEIWITPESQRLIAAFVETEAREALTLRGRETPVIPHHVLSASGRQSRLEAADLVGLTTYTGRETELAILTHCLGLAVRGDGQFATVTGEAGMGKSRLLHEFRQTHEGDKVIVLQGRCQSYGGNIAYLPFIETLRGILGLGHGDSSGTASAELLARVREIGPELEEFIPLYLHLLSI